MSMNPPMQTGNPNFPPQMPTAMPQDPTGMPPQMMQQQQPDVIDAPQPTDPQSQQDPFEMTEQHIALVVNQVLTLMSSSLQAKSAFDAAKSLDPLTNTFKALHDGMVKSRQARAAQPDPQAQMQLEQQKMQHQHALDLMAQLHDEQNNKFNQQLQQQAHDHGLSLEQQKHEAEQQRAGLDQLAQVVQMHQQNQTHQQQQQHAQQNQEQTLSNTDEMHQAQLQQAMQPPTESGSGN